MESPAEHPSNQAMQLTASKPAVYASRVCRRERMLRGMQSGPAAAVDSLLCSSPCAASSMSRLGSPFHSCDSLRLVSRALLVACIAPLLLGCATEQRRTVVVDGKTHCARHSRPLISVQGFQAGSDPLVLVHSAEPRSRPCGERSPNRIYDDQNLTRTSLHGDRARVTYCPVCAADYWRCMGGERELGRMDVQHITALALRQHGFRRPILRIFPVYEHHAVAVGGAEDQVSDVFTYLSVAQRDGRWAVAYPLRSHRIVALGQPRWAP